MSILKIARMGHPVLHQVASTVTDFKDPELLILIQDMIETLKEYEIIEIDCGALHSYAKSKSGKHFL